MREENAEKFACEHNRRRKITTKTQSMTMYNSYLVALVIEGHVATVVGVGAQSSLVLNLSCAVANVKGYFFVLGPDLVSVAPSTRVASRVVLKKIRKKVQH